MGQGVLVVDDARFMRITLSKMLTDYGCVIKGEAENGLDAVQKYRDLSPDLVTMDITMPEMNGIEATREIVKMDAGAKVIVCSAMGQRVMVEDAIKAGARDFIVKPIKADKLNNALKNIFS